MRGFTLLEVMVVVCIIAVLSSIVVIAALPGEAALAEKEARRLAALLELASAEARASGQTIAWSPERDGYSFWRRSDEGEWLRFPDASPYRQRSFGADTAIAGERVMLSPYGLQAPLEVTISGGKAQILLRSGALGRVSLQRLHAD